MDSLRSVLDQVHMAVLRGDLARIATLTPALEAAAIAPTKQDLAEIAKVRQMASRNAICLEGAIAGLKSARRRLDEISAAANGLTIYDRKGGKATVATTPVKNKRV